MIKRKDKIIIVRTIVNLLLELQYIQLYLNMYYYIIRNLAN